MPIEITEAYASPRNTFDLLLELHEYHRLNSFEYANIWKSLYSNSSQPETFEDFPIIPVSLFKQLELKSVGTDLNTKMYQSSGTSGVKSKIFIDSRTAGLQTKALTSTMSNWLGAKRRPMLIVDSPSVLKGTTLASARGAAITAMMRLGKDHYWLVDETGSIDIEELSQWLNAHKNEQIFIFGFTFIIWQQLVQGLNNEHIDLSNATLFHGGGWKKLQDQSVNNETLRKILLEKLNISDVHDYYGMVEQLGSIWVEGEEGILLPTVYSHALIRDPDTLNVLPDGEMGLLQTFSTLPFSYPGHSLLTEDLAIKVPNNYLPERYGDWGLKIHGRLPASEARGCSDAVA